MGIILTIIDNFRYHLGLCKRIVHKNESIKLSMYFGLTGVKICAEGTIEYKKISMRHIMNLAEPSTIFGFIESFGQES